MMTPQCHEATLTAELCTMFGSDQIEFGSDHIEFGSNQVSFGSDQIEFGSNQIESQVLGCVSTLSSRTEGVQDNFV